MATNRSGSRRGLIVGLVIVLVLALGAGAFFVFFNKDSQPDVANGTETLTAVNPNQNGVIDPIVVAQAAQIVPLTPGATAPTAAGVAALVDPILPEFGVSEFSGIIVDAETGTVLYDKGSTKPQIPASTAKLTMATAALTSLDPQSRLSTKVVQGDAAGTVVLVGGGDITLRATSQTESVYAGAPSMTDLAAQVTATGVKPTKIIYDVSRWVADPFAPGWVKSDIGTQTQPGYITNIVPLMVDGDRFRPNLDNSGRTGTPAETAAKALATALGNPQIEIAAGTATPGAAVLGSVDSQPISVLLSQALVKSDNVLAEAIGREVALKEGAPANFVGSTQSILLKLQQLGIDTTGVQLSDVSGLSTSDRLTPKVLADVLALAVKSDNDFRDLILGLPVAGATGTLGARYLLPETGLQGKGWLRAKTGSLTANNRTTYALAGVVPDADGRMMVFSIIVGNVVGDSTRVLMDRIAASLRTCGCVA